MQHSFQGAKKRIGEIWAEMLTNLQSRYEAGELSQSYLHDLKIRAGGFARKFENTAIGEITKAEISDFIDSGTRSARSRKNQRASIVALFRYAQHRGYLKDGKTIADQIKAPREGIVFIEFFTQEEMVFLLQNAEKEILALIALGGFAGLRTSEMERPT